MDIEKEYNKIMDKYGVFACYPRIQKRRKAESLIVSWIKEHLNCNRILCIGTDETELQNIKFLAEQENVQYQYMLCRQGDENKLQRISWNELDCVLLVSLHDEMRIRHWLSEQGIYCESLYDYFSIHNLYLEDEYYRLNIEDMSISKRNDVITWFTGQNGWRNNVFAELLIQKEKYKNAKSDDQRRLFLERQFVLALYIKNFILVKNILCEAENAQITLGSNYLAAWDELRHLIKKIREKLHNRQAEDFILTWMDGLGYGDGYDMPYLQSQISEGVNFTNAFTVLPNTKPTLRTIMNAQKEIDDWGYKKAKINHDYVLISYLQKKGYNVKIISSIMKEGETEFISNINHDLYAPCSEILWDVWRNLLLSQNKIFIIGHLMIETHEPHLSTKLEYSGIDDSYKKGRQEIDEQMEFYLSALSANTVKIFFSDHGQWRIALQRWNTYLVVCSKYMEPHNINEMFSLIDFYKLMEQLIEEKNIQEEKLKRDYVEMQNMDRYNPKMLKDIIRGKKRVEMQMYGYRGIIDKNYVYLHYNTGKEYLTKRDAMLYEPHLQPEADDVCDKTLLPYYRKLAGENPEGFYEDEKFKYSKYSYALYRNFLNYKNPAFDLLNQLVGQYDDHSVAIRPGGAHSMEVFFWLTEENKKKIYCFIDNNPECLCSKLDNAKILPLDKVFEHQEVKAVLLSSYYNLPALKKEAEHYPSEIEILDIYEYFAQHGCKMEHDFFDAYMDDAGYEVGFPMDE